MGSCGILPPDRPDCESWRSDIISSLTHTTALLFRYCHTATLTHSCLNTYVAKPCDFLTALAQLTHMTYADRYLKGLV